MSARHGRRDRIEELCGEPGPEDGTDPRDFFDRDHSRPDNRKALQLCEQVRRALYWALGTECGDPVVRTMDVISVEPAPNSARMLVTLGLPAGEAVSVDEVGRRLSAVAGVLRFGVAREINRRKTPELTYRIVPLQPNA